MTNTVAESPRRVFVSYTVGPMTTAARALGLALERHGVVPWTVHADALVGESWEASVRAAVMSVNAFVILLAPGDEYNRWLQYETRQILTSVWSGHDAHVAVVASAVGAIPSALRHQSFVSYFPQDEIHLERWNSDPATVDVFVDRLLRSTKGTEGTQRPLSDAEIDSWRNAVIQLGRDNGPGAEEKQVILAALRSDLASGQWADTGTGSSTPLETAVQRAVLAEQLGDPELATAYFNLAFDAAIDTRPNDDADLLYASGLAALGTSRPREAADAFSRAATINESSYGLEDPRTVAALYNLGLALSAAGDYDGATRSYRSALAASQRGLGSRHPQTANAAFNLAQLRARAGDVSEAISLLTEAEDAYEQVTPAGSAELAAVRSELSRLRG